MSSPWACPHCTGPTKLVSENRINVWCCAACEMSWVPGDIVASLVDRPTEVRSIVDTARAAPTSPRSLRCPKCRTSSLHELKVRGVPIDVCDRCGGMALDPNEGKVLDRLSSGSYSASERAIDAAQGAEALLQIVITVVKLTKALL